MPPKIASGYFYDVYDMGDGRILKKKRPFYKIARSLQGKSKLDFLSLIVKTFRYIQDAKRNTKIVREKTASIPQELLGNPKFLNAVDYTQDKVVLLMDYFDTNTLEENKVVVGKYVALIKELFEFGIHDYVYKFKNSYGVNSRGGIVFIDFNEVTFSKEKTLELAQAKHWKQEAQFRKFPEGELKDFIELKLAETITPDVVNNSWKNILLSGTLCTHNR